ncbi:glycosyltransferase [Shimia marina]|uniref:glycosyltransferase n=2 Tax=Shimia marina TaxID=321267 RepID=UPI0008EB7591|nr:glycosyltransferase [Shimia marina]SFE49952.1 Glycosyltransferase, catalytic subunit of cellulose synthase and poly-beta-1,6-N-acetylglucosamine synthase [Shimia marina]
MRKTQPQREALPRLPPARGHLPLARILIEQDLLAPWQLFYAMHCQSLWDSSLPEILIAQRWIRPETLRAVLAHRYGLRQIDLSRTPPAPAVANLLPPKFCLQHNILPWAKLGTTPILATGRPHTTERLQQHLPPFLKNALFASAAPQDIETHILLHQRRRLTHEAETSVADEQSCRGFAPESRHRTPSLLLALFFILGLCLVLPKLLLISLTILGLLTLGGAISLRVMALAHFLRPLSAGPPILPAFPPRPDDTMPTPPILSGAERGSVEKLPKISVLVPLFHETEIATALIRRLTQLTYPRALLDVILVLEEKDRLTRATIARTRLPSWMRVVQVPAGSGITTKPRALNYALPFCKGRIIGIWDAEDAPAPDQLEQVAAAFAHAPPEVACVQGVLDFYNPYTNWMSRCFTLEYAAWFRLILPALCKMGFAIPLGGTTVFLRRDVLEAVGGWDSHNVTEDADLGIRLARHGYRAIMLASTTHEEANCRPIAWIRQRSRWLKGYMATYLVHMRAPHKLLAELGLRQFLGFQILFLCTISQFLIAPLFWSFWLALFGAPHLLAETLPASALSGIAALLLLAGLINGLVWICAANRCQRPRLWVWSLTMALYFPLATAAAYKGLIEMIVAPFYWDKTSHGKTTEATQHDLPSQETAPPVAQPR